MQVFRIMWGRRLVAEAPYKRTPDDAFDALIEWTNAQMPLQITRTGPRTAVTASGISLRLVIA